MVEERRVPGFQRFERFDRFKVDRAEVAEFLAQLFDFLLTASGAGRVAGNDDFSFVVDAVILRVVGGVGGVRGIFTGDFRTSSFVFLFDAEFRVGEVESVIFANPFFERFDLLRESFGGDFLRADLFAAFFERVAVRLQDGGRFVANFFEPSTFGARRFLRGDERFFRRIKPGEGRGSVQNR